MKAYYFPKLPLNAKSLFLSVISFFLIVLKSQSQTTLPTGFYNISTVTYSDYIIPNGIKELRITLTGGSGGNATADACRKNGGKGAQVSASFFVGNACANTILTPGGTLRIIKGGDGQSDISDGKNTYGSGGGGSAALYL